MKYKNQTTIYDIAREAGVSVATVSRVLNHPDLVTYDTRQKILQVINTLGFQNKTSYKKAASKSSLEGITRKNNSNLFIINVPTLNNPFYGDVISGATSAASRHGHFLLVNGLNYNKYNIDSLLTMVDSSHASGLITMNQFSDDLLLRIQSKIPLVQCSEYSETCTSISYVSIDDISASKKAVEYALNCGHNKVAFLTSPLYNRYADRRKIGYLQALHNAGIDLEDEWIIQIPDIDFSMAANAVSKLLAIKNPPNAIFAVSDVYAAAAVKAALTIGFKIPQDIIIIGFDNVNISITTTPSITTVSQPRYQLGYTAFEILLNEVVNPLMKKQQIFLDTELIIRDSTIKADVF